MKKIKYIISLFIFGMVILFSQNIYAEELNVEIKSPSAILIDANTGKVFYEKNADQRMYPASTTKIMTALLTLENVTDLSQKATVSYENVYTVPAGYSIDTLKVGEEFTIEELLYALLVKSSNEAAYALADYIAGSTESFATMMNTRALELGCTNTNFVNPNGIQNENHYSTSRDLSIIAREAMKNSEFRKIVSTASYTLPATNKYDKADRKLLTTNDIINRLNKNYYEYAIGIKTGYTSQAKNCLVAGANKDGVELIAVVLGADKRDESGYSVRDVDVKNMFEFIYGNYSNKNISKSNETIIKTVKVKRATSETRNLNLLTDKDINILLSNNDKNKEFEGNITLNENIKAPIAKGTVLGIVTYENDGIKYEANLIAANDVEKTNLILNILKILLAVVILLIIYFFTEKSRKKSKKNKYKYLYK